MVQDVCIYANICSETCAKCVRKGYLSFICVQMLRISRYLPVRCAKGAEFVFAVHFWSSLD